MQPCKILVPDFIINASIMKIAVIAANGRSGQAFIEEALQSGHQIRGGILGKSFLPEHPNLTTIKCDATNPEEVKALIQGSDAVVTLIGHVKGSAPDVQTKAIKIIISAMDAEKINRLVSLTGTGVRFPGDKVTLTDRFLNLGVSLVDPSRVSDGKNHVKELQKSGLDWTLIRVLKLQNTTPKPFILKENGPPKTIVSREEVASAILEVLEDQSFIKKAPIITKA